MSLGRLKDHERLLIWRVRSKKTQAQAARKLRMTPAKYATMEMGRASVEGRPATVLTEVNSFSVPKIPENGKHLEAFERCLLYRRRTGKSQAVVAKGIKLSRYWVNRMERGLAPCDTLLWYWEQ